MSRLGTVAIVATAAVVFLGFACTTITGAAANSLSGWQAEQTRHAAQMNAIEEAKASAQAERDAAFWKDIGIVTRLTASVGLGALGALSVALAIWAVAAAVTGYWNKRDILVIEGVPMSRQLVVSSDLTAPAMLIAVSGRAAERVKAAERPMLLPGVKYTDARRYVEGKQPAPSLPAPQAPALPAPAVIPPFYRLLDDGIISPSSDLALGFEPDGQLVSTPMDGLFSVAVAGLPGSGKTNTATWIAGQAVLHGARILIADLHANGTGKAGEQSLARSLSPLHSAFLARPADTPDAVAGLARELRSEVERRKAGAQGNAILFAVDEFTALMRSSAADELASLLEAIGQEGRKFGVFPLLCAQVWTVDRVGGSAVRDVLASSFVHRSKPGQARLLAPGLGNEVFSLPVGHAFLNMTNGETARVTIPRVTRNDLFRVADMLPAPSTESWQPAQPTTDNQPATAQNAPTTSATDNRQRIQELNALGWSRNQISREVFGHKDDGTMAEIRAVLGEVS